MSLEEKLLKILEKRPYNTAQVCRQVRDKSPYDIELCRPKPVKITGFRKQMNFHIQGPYVNCVHCKPYYGKVWRVLNKLEKRDLIESRKEWRNDPIKRGAKDNVRMWALKGKLPSLDPFLRARA